MATAKLAFLPWLRQGAAASISTRDDGSSTLDAEAAFDVEVAVNGTAVPAVTLRLHGPGDVIGLDPAQILRTVPGDLTADFPPNLLAAVEFDRPDLPWLFSPAKASTADRLRPWLTLIVVERRDGVTIGPRPEVPLPVLSIADRAADELPPLAESWAWAHTQIAGTLAGADLETVVRDAPQRTSARLLCPRALRAETPYFACLVPAFAAGVQAGLGQPVTTTDLTPAWTGSEDAIALPVFHQWRFSTGAAGTFESLVKLLEPRPLPTGLGRRPMDVSRPGFGMPDEVAPVILGLTGALRPPGAVPTPWPAAARARFQTALTQLLDAPETHTAATAGEELVGAPLYGRWHAARRTVPPPGVRPLWLRDLNLDPRHRVAAGVGTQVVQLQQEELMASAWGQVGEILRANQLLRVAQLARAAATSLYARHLAPLREGALLLLAGPAFARVRVAAGTTARGALDGRCLTPAMVSGAFRKVMRPRGPISRRFRRTSDRPLVLGQAVRDVGAGKHRLPPAPPPTGMEALDEAMVARLFEVREPDRALAAHLDHLRGLAAEQDDPSCDQLDTTGLASAVLAALEPAKTIPVRVLEQLDLPSGLWEPEDPLEPIMAAPEFRTPMYLGLKDLSQEWLLPGLKDLPANTVTIAETNAPFVEAYLAGLNHEMSRELLWRDFPTDQRGSYFRQFWDPRGRIPAPTTDAAREAARDIPPVHTWDRATVLGTHLSGSAGSGQVVLLVRGDLLRRYPRATVCLQRAEWSTSSAGLAVAPRRLADPATPDAVRHPIFSAALDPDVALLGFDLAAVTVRGRPDPSAADPGWFVVFAEQPTEPHFGFGPAGTATAGATAWSGIDWTQVTVTASGHIDVAATATGAAKPVLDAIGTATGVAWGAQSAAMAAIALQHPFRLAIHADDLVP